ncbi:MAG: 6-phosphogluconate dehydrogenase, decarboxylating [Candidatus Pacebacteria bacterium GW2011_GWF2_38_9]|nr:MAG: 6-phosphogluconate dehydrogenase, 6-phosphogluconate dehydrogenase [candidate division TM6 bacterium GW2011_GWF2_28_16]KKQ07644.1 MAG: 6-phosphogluconate dehydrogenase, decarboxylating [Candidatus Pacebacteria bacterium GW2011_GWF1_36_5]KKQ88738.1 MAG: 6-phosphogluconate dehydrogenase, decarboxylating [Candidatus Pacebacteria bacterium GW2011_GWF2_38_9]
MKIAYIGLGKMGKNMVLRLLEQGIEVVAWNRSEGPVAEVVAAGATAASNFKELLGSLAERRIIWLMLPAGEVTDQIISELLPDLKTGDLLIDGGNSFYKDTIRRSAELAQKGINYLDIGVSGGPGGARSGACMMIGGDKADYELLLPVIKAACAPDAYGYMGGNGAGHFVKMVHNGIEYGMMQAIAEGAAVLEESPFKPDLAEVFRVYNNKSVIESRLVEWARQAFAENPKLDNISSTISHTGEGEWTIQAAKELGIEVPVIEKSFAVRVNSVNEKENFRNKVVSVLRNKFGHHKASKD